MTQLIIVLEATFYGIFLGYPTVIEGSGDEMTPGDKSFMLKMSSAFAICALIVLTIDAFTAILLLISMKRIYMRIKTNYQQWNPNLYFIALQVIIFITPVLASFCAFLVYKPSEEEADTLTYEEMMFYSLI